MMHNFHHLQAAVTALFQEWVPDIRIRRDNELHIQLTRGGDVLRLAAMLQTDFNATLIFMAANDRRAQKGIFEVHYLFTNHAENWFVHATKELPADDPQLDSMATFYLPAGRMEREIHDTFGIQAVGHPLTRRLVRHSFWPETYYPLRKDAVPPTDFQGQGTPYPF